MGITGVHDNKNFDVDDIHQLYSISGVRNTNIQMKILSTQETE